MSSGEHQAACIITPMDGGRRRGIHRWLDRGVPRRRSIGRPPAAHRARIWNQAMYASARSLASAVPIASPWSTEASQVRAAFSPSAAPATLSWDASGPRRARSRRRSVAPIAASSDCACALCASRACRVEPAPWSSTARVVHCSADHDARAAPVVRVVGEHARRIVDTLRASPRPRSRRARGRGSTSSRRTRRARPRPSPRPARRRVCGR